MEGKGSCAVFSSALALAATVDVFRFQTHHVYGLIGEQRKMRTTRLATFKLCFALAFALVSFCLCIAFLAVGYSLPEGTATDIAGDPCSYAALRNVPRGEPKNACSNCASNKDADGNRIDPVPAADGVVRCCRC